MSSPISAALEVIDREGHNALSVRRLARMLNYSRSGAAYRIGSMGDLEAQVRSVVMEEVGQAMLGDPPYVPDSDDWRRASVRRVLAWARAHQNRALFLVRSRPTEDVHCPVVGDALPQLLGSDRPPWLSANYMIGLFALMFDISRLLDDEERVIEACAGHFETAWLTLVRANELDLLQPA